MGMEPLVTVKTWSQYGWNLARTRRGGAEQSDWYAKQHIGTWGWTHGDKRGEKTPGRAPERVLTVVSARDSGRGGSWELIECVWGRVSEQLVRRENGGARTDTHVGEFFPRAVPWVL